MADFAVYLFKRDGHLKGQGSYLHNNNITTKLVGELSNYTLYEGCSSNQCYHVRLYVNSANTQMSNNDTITITLATPRK
jgi:hypothetical protein